jgi:hypothetical protein
LTFKVPGASIIPSQHLLALSFEGSITVTATSRLKVYPKVILQLTTLSLLFAFSSSALTIMPAITAPANQPAEASEVTNATEGQVTTAKAAEAKAKTEPKKIVSTDYGPLTDSKNVERFINDYFADIPIMAKVAKCESRYRQYKNGEVLQGEQNSLDRGVMQINLHYHGKTAEEMGLDVHNIDDNVAYARYLYEKQGVKPWMSSSPCWNKYLEGSEVATK